MSVLPLSPRPPDDARERLEIPGIVLPGDLGGWSGKVVSITWEHGRGRERQLGTKALCVA